MTLLVPDGKDHWGVHIIAAMTAGATGTIVTNPLWLIRTRFMASPAVSYSAMGFDTEKLRFRP